MPQRPCSSVLASTRHARAARAQIVRCGRSLDGSRAVWAKWRAPTRAPHNARSRAWCTSAAHMPWRRRLGSSLCASPRLRCRAAQETTVPVPGRRAAAPCGACAPAIDVQHSCELQCTKQRRAAQAGVCLKLMVCLDNEDDTTGAALVLDAKAMANKQGAAVSIVPPGAAAARAGIHAWVATSLALAPQWAVLTYAVAR